MEIQGTSGEGLQEEWKFGCGIVLFCGWLDFGVCAVSALLRALTEEEAIAHACVSKSRYHEVKKHLLEIIVLPPKNGIGGKSKSKKRCWPLRENDRYDTIYGVSGNVQVSVR